MSVLMEISITLHLVYNPCSWREAMAAADWLPGVYFSVYLLLLWIEVAAAGFSKRGSSFSAYNIQVVNLCMCKFCFLFLLKEMLCDPVIPTSCLFQWLDRCPFKQEKLILLPLMTTVYKGIALSNSMSLRKTNKSHSFPCHPASLDMIQVLKSTPQAPWIKVMASYQN